MSCITAFIRAGAFCALLTLGICVYAEDVRLSSVKRLPTGEVEVTITGAPFQTVILQATSDFRSWQDLQTLTLAAEPVSYVDSQATSLRERSYRVRTAQSPVSED